MWMHAHTLTHTHRDPLPLDWQRRKVKITLSANITLSACCLTWDIVLSYESIYQMCSSGMKAAAMTTKIRNAENMKAWFLSHDAEVAVACDSDTEFSYHSMQQKISFHNTATGCSYFYASFFFSNTAVLLLPTSGPPLLCFHTMCMGSHL